jgi:hypothetical protein
MVVESEGYNSLIEYLATSLSLFASSQGDVGTESVEEIVTDMISSNIMALFEQNPSMHTSVRFQLLKEVDALVADLAEILSSVWKKPATNQQVEFLEDYVGLIKNMFDSAVAAYD